MRLILGSFLVDPTIVPRRLELRGKDNLHFKMTLITFERKQLWRRQEVRNQSGKIG